MASPIKTNTNLFNNQSIAAGATATSAWVNCSGFFEMLSCVNISGSIPSSGATLFHYISPNPNNGNSIYIYQQLDTLTSIPTYITEISDPSIYYQLAVKNNDAASVAILVTADLMHEDSVQ